MIAKDMSEPGSGAGLETPWVLARVRGPSMAPTLRSGDRLLVRRVAPGARVAVGKVVLARFPARPELLVVKRVRRAAAEGAWVVAEGAWVVAEGAWVEGDNALVGDDSRAYGPALVVGRVLLRLWPRPGRVPGPPAG